MKYKMFALGYKIAQTSIISEFLAMADSNT